MSADKLVFNSGSKHKYPGKGKGEHVSKSSQYEELDQIRDWRQVLSNFHVAPFSYDGHRYNTIEHAFQAKKIALVDPKTALKFTLGNELGNGGGAEAQSNNMLVVLPGPQVKHWNAIRDRVMAEAARCKYAECKEAQQVLLATNEAELWHEMRNGQLVRFKHLEELRQEYRAAADASSDDTTTQ